MLSVHRVLLRKLRAAAALYATNKDHVQPRPQSRPALTDFRLQPYIAIVCSLMVSIPVIHVIT